MIDWNLSYWCIFFDYRFECAKIIINKLHSNSHRIFNDRRYRNYFWMWVSAYSIFNQKHTSESFSSVYPIIFFLALSSDFLSLHLKMLLQLRKNYFFRVKDERWCCPVVVLVKNWVNHALKFSEFCCLFLPSVFRWVTKRHRCCISELAKILLRFEIKKIFTTFLIAFLCSFWHELNNFNQIVKF